LWGKILIIDQWLIPYVTISQYLRVQNACDKNEWYFRLNKILFLIFILFAKVFSLFLLRYRCVSNLQSHFRFLSATLNLQTNYMQQKLTVKI